jgi:hypothetical protein
VVAIGAAVLYASIVSSDWDERFADGVTLAGTVLCAGLYVLSSQEPKRPEIVAREDLSGFDAVDVG